METLVVSPAISQRKVEDWPRWMVLGSAVNWLTVGALGAGAGLGVSTGCGGGGGGGGGAFFLHPAANIASASAIPITVIFRLLNMNYRLQKLSLRRATTCPTRAVRCGLRWLAAAPVSHPPA